MSRQPACSGGIPSLPSAGIPSSVPSALEHRDSELHSSHFQSKHGLSIEPYTQLHRHNSPLHNSLTPNKYIHWAAQGNDYALTPLLSIWPSRHQGSRYQSIISLRSAVTESIQMPHAVELMVKVLVLLKYVPAGFSHGQMFIFN